MRCKPFLCSLIFLPLFGCAQSAPAYRPGAALATVKAPAEQQFNLYARGNRIPIMCEVLLKNEQVGFARNDSGALAAVAGRVVRPLPEGTYFWKPLPLASDSSVSDNDVVRAESIFGGTLVFLDSLGQPVRK